MVCVALKMKKWVVSDVVVTSSLNLRHEKKLAIFADKISCEFGVFTLFSYWRPPYCKCSTLLEYLMHPSAARVNQIKNKHNQMN